MKVIKLNIIEPWEYGTDKAVDASIVGEENDQYLIQLSKPMKFKNSEARYFLATLRDKSLNGINKSGKYLLSMVYSEDINELNYKGYKISEFRSGFLIGEAILD
jgi:hypothetical protein